MRVVKPEELTLRPFHILDKRWALLVAGAQNPNPMTVSWGGFGTLWNRPVVTVYVRPTRHTFTRLASQPEFTLNVLPPERREALNLCGSLSGRDVDKWAAAGLKPLPSERVAVPRVEGADLSFECRILANMDLDPGHFLDSGLEGHYQDRDYHRVFLGEVLLVWVSDAFQGG